MSSKYFKIGKYNAVIEWTHILVLVDQVLQISILQAIKLMLENNIAERQERLEKGMFVVRFALKCLALLFSRTSCELCYQQVEL